MNIQLRDSQSLQTAIKARLNKKDLPKHQLHPELLHGLVDCDREGFEIRSEMQVGENRGEPDPIDVRNLSDFLPAPDTCQAQWKIVQVKQGDSMVTIPSELVFTFVNGGKIAVRTQAVPDVTKLTSALATDRIATFEVTHANGRLTFTRQGARKPASVDPITDAELQLLAAQRGVKYDKNASRETNIERIAAAEPKKKAEKEQPAGM